MILLFLDLLGTKAEWVRNGRPGVEEACKGFRERILEALAAEGADSVARGAVESDSAALLFDDADAALRVARRIYISAFLIRPSAKVPRQWLRGAILSVKDEPLRSERPFAGKFKHLVFGTYSDGLLDAISTEKAGYKGMRLLIQDEVISARLRQAWRISVAAFSLIPFRRLRYSGYPTRLKEGFQDFLWMYCKDPEEWKTLQLRMAARLRFAAPDLEEGTQAAATQVVFHECAAIQEHLVIRSLRRYHLKGNAGGQAARPRKRRLGTL